MASNLPYHELLNKTRLKKRAPVHNTQEQLHFFNYPIKNIRGFYEYFMSHLLTNEQLRDQPDGIYTWVMTTSHDLYAMRTQSSQEIGTLHANIIQYIELREQRAPDPLAAGELELTTDPATGERQVQFNFQSSFFVSEILKKQTKKRKLPENEFQRELAHEVSLRFQELFPDRTVTPVLGVELIEPTRFLSVPNVVNAYNRFLTRANVLPKHRALSYSRSFPSQVKHVHTNGSRNNNKNRNNTNRNTKRRTYQITGFQPSEPLTGFSMGVSNNNKSKKNTRRKGRK